MNCQGCWHSPKSAPETVAAFQFRVMNVTSQSGIHCAKWAQNFYLKKKKHPCSKDQLVNGILKIFQKPNKLTNKLR
jgi:hypothetical protein